MLSDKSAGESVRAVPFLCSAKVIRPVTVAGWKLQFPVVTRKCRGHCDVDCFAEVRILRVQGMQDRVPILSVRVNSLIGPWAKRPNAPTIVSDSEWPLDGSVPYQGPWPP